MFDNYTYKNKFRALILLFLLFFILAYSRAIKPLLQTFGEYRQLKEIASQKNSERDLKVIKGDINQLNRLIGSGGIGREKIQNEIINFISVNGAGTSLVKLESIHEFSENNYIIYTYQLDLVGDLNMLLKTLYGFEKQFEYSKVVSANFYTSKETNKNIKLHLSIIFQNYENNK